MATVRPAWTAAIERVRDGVHLLISHDGRQTSQQWFAGAEAALKSAPARQFRWRLSTAIGSPVLLRGDLGPLGGE